MPRILLNIGNTHTSILADEKRVVKTSDLISGKVELAQGKKHFFCCSVVPPAKEALPRLYPKSEFTFLNYKHLNNIDFSEVDPSTIGADR